LKPSVRYKLNLAYCGADYFGWQVQVAGATWKGARPKTGKLRTVQGVLTEHIGRIVGHPVTVVGSSRTDTGVHAKGQVAHFDTTSVHIPPEGLRRAVNNRLPDDVVINTIVEVPSPNPDTHRGGFDAIGDAVHKRYQYLIWHSLNRNVLMEHLAFHRWHDVNVDAMAAGAAHLVGTMDYTSFCRPGHGRESTVRTISDCSVSQRGKLIVVSVAGNGFLWNQVRIIVGTLVEVGIGRFKSDDIRHMLDARDRRAAGSTAPSHGLYLQWIQHRLNRGRGEPV